MQWLLSGEPYEVQSVALEKCGQRRGFAYFMEMGLGKTAVVLAEFKWLLSQNLADVLIVICPNSLKQNWVDELDKWETGLRGMKWNEYKVSSKTKEGNFYPDRTPTMVMNYEAFSGGACPGLDFCMAVAKGKRVMLVLDESVQIKKYNAKRTVNLLALAPFCPFVRVLSGAPCVQGPHDLWAQLRMLGAFKGYQYHAFRNRYCKMGGHMSKQVIGAKNTDELNGILNEWGFRARKVDWTNLPEKLPAVNRYVEMLPEQRRAYEEMARDFVTYVNRDTVIEAQIVITQLLKLQQITSGFVFDGDRNVVQLVDVPPKTEEVLALSEEIEGKLIVFTHFRPTTTLLRDALRDRLNPAMLIGGMSDGEISAEKRKFAEDPDCRAFVIQDETGKYGHTLIGDQKDDKTACCTSVFYENSYSLDTRLQAEDRNHRHGQRRAVSYFDLISSPIDLRAISALQRKEDVASAVVDGIRKER